MKTMSNRANPKKKTALLRSKPWLMIGLSAVALGAVLLVINFTPSKTAAAKDPTPAQLTPWQIEQRAYDELWEARDTGNPAITEAAFKDFLSSYQFRTDVRKDYAEWLTKQGRYGEALAQFKLYMSPSPDLVPEDGVTIVESGGPSAPDHLQLARLYELTGQQAKADETYLSLAHHGPWSLGSIMPTLEYTGSDPRIAEAMTKAIVSVGRIGMYAVDDPGFPVAEQLMREALALAPDWPELLYYGGWVMFQYDNWYEADELYDRADALSDDPILEEAIVQDRRYVDSALWYYQQHPDQQP